MRSGTNYGRPSYGSDDGDEGSGAKPVYSVSASEEYKVDSRDERTLNGAWKFLALLSPAQRRAAVVLLALMLVGMVLETLGIGLVIPVITVMTRGDLASDFPVLAPWLERLGNPRHETLVIGSMLTLVGVSTLKALFLGFLAWWAARFSFGLQADLSQRLFAGYLGQPYAFHLQRNSAQLIRNIIRQVDQVRAVTQVGLTMVAESLVLVGVSTLLLVAEPAGTLWVVGTLSLAGWAFHFTTQERLLRWGVARQLHEGQRIQHLQQGLGGAKDVKLLGREAGFLAQYDRHNAENARIGQCQATLDKFPRLWIELLAILGLTVLMLVMIGQGKSLEVLLPMLGLFGAAAFRLLPSVTRILSSAQNLRTTRPVIDNLYDEFELIGSDLLLQDCRPIPFRRNLALEAVTFTYPAAHTPSLSEITLSITPGTSVGFIGTTGAGKSTLVDVLLGLLEPEVGAVRVDGVDIRTTLRGWQDQIGYVPQSIFLTDDTLRRNIAFGLSEEEIDGGAVERAVGAAQLDAFVQDAPNGLETVVGERGVRLSGGQRQRIGIARALYHDPAVLVLDEATSSLDADTERQVMKAVNTLKGDKTLVIVAHRLSTVQHCDRIFRLEQGRLVEEGQTAEMLGARATRDLRS